MRQTQGTFMRRDALERREALIHAAAVCFAEAGYNVPLEEIADRAGVGRGTLYRNFRDRMELVLVIFAREVEAIGADLNAAMSLSELIEHVVRRGLGTRLLFARLMMDMPIDDASRASFNALFARMAEILSPFVEQARARGEIRADVSAEQVVLGVRMISGLVKSPVAEHSPDALIADGLDLLLRGLRG